MSVWHHLKDIADTQEKDKLIEGLGKDAERKLRHIGVETAEELAITTVRELNAVGIEKPAVAFIEAARDLVGVTSFRRASDLKPEQILKTGSEALDTIIRGGYECRKITELISPEGVAKTQVAFTAAVMAQLPVTQGGLDGKVVFIDTEGSFDPPRIQQIATARGLDPTLALDNIFVESVENTDKQVEAVIKAGRTIRENNVRLIILDSLTHHWRSEYLGRENLPDRQGGINQHIHLLLRRAQVYNAVVIMTNQVIANPNAMFGNPDNPAGGHVVGHAAQLRLALRRGPKGVKIARIIDSSHCEPDEAVFIVNESGACDPPKPPRVVSTEAV